MLRLAFVGQGTYFRACALHAPHDGVEPAFFDLRPGTDPYALNAELRDHRPDVVFVWRPELIPAGAFADLEAITVGYLTEPLPRPGLPSHEDLELRLGYLRNADAGQFDLLAAYDPHVAPAATALMPVWRTFPLPVADELLAPVRPPTGGEPRLVFVGRSTPHRDAFLDPLKHEFDVVHVAHGITDDDLVALFARADAAVNLHNEPYPNYENRVSLSLAAGLLVLTEPLSPAWGLEPGVDLVVTRRPWELREVVASLRRTPDAFATVRRSGRAKAERFRASRVWPAVAREALAAAARVG